MNSLAKMLAWCDWEIERNRRRKDEGICFKFVIWGGKSRTSFYGGGVEFSLYNTDILKLCSSFAGYVKAFTEYLFSLY